MADTFPIGGYLRCVRRRADLSQRGLAHTADVSQSVVAKLEGGRRTRPSLATVQKLLAVGGLRLIVVDERGVEIEPLPEPAQRDFAGRHYPAHLDVRRYRKFGDWWFDWYSMTLAPAEKPAHTFTLSRLGRDSVRRRASRTAADDDDRYDLVGEGTAPQRVTDLISGTALSGTASWP